MNGPNSRRGRAAVQAALLLLSVPVVAQDFDEIKHRGSLRVLAVTSRDPDDFFAPSAGVGFDREVLEAFARFHRLSLEVVPQTAWDALVPALLQGKGDVIAGRFTVTEQRRKAIAFTEEVFPTRNVVVTRRPHPAVTTVEQLRQVKVGTVKGTSLAEAVTAAGVPTANVDDSVPSGTLPAALKAGKVAAVVMGIEDAIAEQRRDPEIEVGAFLGPPGALAYGVRKQDTHLREALDEYLRNYRRSGNWSRLVVKYFSAQALDVLKKARETAGPP